MPIATQIQRLTNETKRRGSSTVRLSRMWVLAYLAQDKQLETAHAEIY